MLGVMLWGALGNSGRSEEASQGYATPDKAAQAVLALAAECSGNRRECGGIIFAVKDRYYFTYPITSGYQFGVDLSMYQSEGWKAYADYHTHICNRHNRVFANYFSPADAIVDSGFHIIGYMLSLCDGNIRRFDPDENPQEVMEVDFSSGRQLLLPLGHIVGYVPYLNGGRLPSRH